jgi:hypothetical protein
VSSKLLVSKFDKFVFYNVRCLNIMRLGSCCAQPFAIHSRVYLYLQNIIRLVLLLVLRESAKKKNRRKLF